MTRFALNRPVTVLMLTLGLCLAGVLSWQRLPVQLLPEFIYPEVHVGAGLPGATPEQVEKELAIPIEAAIAQLEGVHDIETTVYANATSIRVVYNYGTDMDFALLKLQQKMNSVGHNLPRGSRIRIDKFDTADFASYLMQISIRGQADQQALRETAERRVRPRLEQIDGVVNLTVGGGRRKRVSIDIDEEKCRALGIPVQLVSSTIDRFHRRSEFLGRIEHNGRRVDVSIPGQVDDLYQLRHLVIRPAGPVFLKDVARIHFGEAERTQLFRIDGKSSVSMLIQKDNLSNMLAVADAVLQEIENLNAKLRPAGYELVVNFNQAELISTAIERIKSLALAGALLALVVLFLFLRSLRFVLILMVAIPVSLLVTFNFMYAWGLSINILSLCGLALAIGMLVDNGIVVMENIFSHYRRSGKSDEAALQGTREMTRSIFAATGTTILVFLPVLFVESEARLFLRELALSVVAPLLVSLVVAITVIPLLARLTLKDSQFAPLRSSKVLQLYRVLLKAAIRHRMRAVSTVAVLLLISLLLGSVFILSESPPPPPERLDVYITMDEGATLESTDAAVRRVEQQIAGLEQVAEYRTIVREGEAQIAISFLKAHERTAPLNIDEVRRMLTRRNARLRNADISFEPRHRTAGTRRSTQALTGLLEPGRSLILRGDDLSRLESLSRQIVQTLRGMSDIERNSVQANLRTGRPELRIEGDRLRLALWGLTMQDMMQTILATQANGANTATPFPDKNGEVAMAMTLQDADQRRLEDIREIRVINSRGEAVPLREVATIRTDEGPGSIVRRNQQREVQISYNFTKQARQSKSRLGRAEQQVARLVQDMRLPRGFTLLSAEKEDKQQVYYAILGLGALLIFMFLAAQFESFSGPLVVLGTIPTAIVGALFALTLSDTPMTLGEGAPMALLGFIVLLGIVVNNGIILLDRIAVLRTRRGFRWQRAVLNAGQSRVRPVIMTSATTVLGVLPLALKQGTELELWPPFAITILGGLSVSALATLVFIPVLYVGIEQTRAWLAQSGIPAVVVGTLLAAGLLWWFHLSLENGWYTVLVALPLWFAIMALVHVLVSTASTRRRRIELARSGPLHIRIRNLTKIYGAPGRFRREWQRLRARTSDDRAGLHDAAVLLAAAGVLLGYLHTFFTAPFWLIVLGLLSLLWLFRVRALWQSWRSSNDGTNRPATATGEKTGWRQHLYNQGLPALFILLFFVFIQLRLGDAAITLLLALLFLMTGLMRSTAQAIAEGRIDAEQPAPPLRKLKRLYYVFVRTIPGIRPPLPQVTALHGVDLDISTGMFGLLGPNGAGKTTLMRIIVGVLEQTRGSITINGDDLDKHRAVYHGSIGYLPQDVGLYENMTPMDFLDYHALTNGIYDAQERSSRIEMILRNVGLWQRRHTLIRDFSGGMKQRVGIAQTLLHLPQIIVVDEPTAGLDPKERIRFRNLLSELARERIVIFSTHIVEDISSTCRELAVLVGGKVKFRGSPADLQKLAAGKVFEAVVAEEAFDGLHQQVRIIQHSKAEQGVRIRFLTETGTDIQTARVVEPNLEDAYIYLLSTDRA